MTFLCLSKMSSLVRKKTPFPIQMPQSCRFGDGGDSFVMQLEENSTAAAIAGYVGTTDWRLPVYSYVVLCYQDAGCTDEMAERFMTLQDSEDQQIRLLSGHRKRLLETLHQVEKRIDCLDYLIYQMQNRK